MGNQTSELKRTLEVLASETHFTRHEIAILHSRFLEMTNEKAKKGMPRRVDEQEFVRFLGSSSQSLSKRVFAILDKKKQSSLSFEEFVRGLSILCVQRGTLEEKIHLAFLCYDINGDGKISEDELALLLQASVNETGLNLKPSLQQMLVKRTFESADMDGDGYIDEHEFECLTEQNRSIVFNMSTDLSNILKINE